MGRKNLGQKLRRARAALEELHRQLAQATGREYVVPVDLGFLPEEAVSGASLVQKEGAETVLTFNAMKELDNGARIPCGEGVVRFKHLLLTKFGLPNDEAQKGHPLYNRGFDVFYSPSNSVLSLLMVREIAQAVIEEC